MKEENFQKNTKITKHIENRMKQIMVLICIPLMACLIPLSATAEDSLSQPAHPVTAQKNQAVSKLMNFADRQDFEDSKKGFIATWDELVIKDEKGEVVWNMPEYDFLSGDPVDTVNPSLWRQEQLNNMHGLFKISGILPTTRCSGSHLNWILFDGYQSTIQCTFLRV